VNAPVKSAATLDELYAERKAILSKVEEIKATRAKLDALDAEVEVAKSAMIDFSNKSAAALQQWTTGLCQGPKPSADFGSHQILERKFIEAQHAAGLADSAKNSLNIREMEITVEFHEVSQSIKNAIAGLMAKEFETSGTRAKKLRDELDERDAKLLAGRAFFVGLSESFIGETKTRNPTYDAAVASAEAALPETDAHAVKNFDMHDPGQFGEIDARFWRLFREG
jgi:hypothetical protein